MEPGKLYLKIGDVARELGVTPSTIRYWEQEFTFFSPKKNSKGTRYYDRKALDKGRIIQYLLKEKGMTVQGARDYLDRRKKEGELDKTEVIATLKRARDFLTMINNSIGRD